MTKREKCVNTTHCNEFEQLLNEITESQRRTLIGEFSGKYAAITKNSNDLGHHCADGDSPLPG